MSKSLALLLITVLAACQATPETAHPSPIVLLPEDTATAPATPFPTTTPLPPTETDYGYRNFYTVDLSHTDGHQHGTGNYLDRMYRTCAGLCQFHASR